ncbi:MAG: NAD(P)-dependent oxidoreductase [Flavobacteriaceae bacterium]|jgi:UDP-glucuronate decarboxylase|nr:NAD(P)-dependent oxidoreductase [Flavobacteriaceae bacterium]
MNIIVTGSNGIIGQQLINSIISEYPHHKILLINRKKSNTLFNKSISSLELDLLRVDKNKLNEIFKKFKPKKIFHLAWNTNHSDYLSSLENIEWEVSSKRLIDCFYNNGGKKFIGIGSSIEYDWNYDSPFIENHSLLSNDNYLYSKCKMNVLNHLKKYKNEKYLWARVFFVFGPNQGKSRLIPKLISNALTGYPKISVVLDLERDYLSTFEIAKQLIMIEKTNHNGEFNVCSGIPIKLEKIVEIISQITKKKLNLLGSDYNGPLKSKIVFGSRKLINKLYPNYKYNINDIKKDLIKTIKF